MPDDHHPLMPRCNPEDFDLRAIKTDLEFLMERLSKLPTRQELAPATALRDLRWNGGVRNGYQ
jgi:hypothetical protein